LKFSIAWQSGWEQALEGTMFFIAQSFAVANAQPHEKMLPKWYRDLM
jgi:hypothetical protein